MHLLLILLSAFALGAQTSIISGPFTYSGPNTSRLEAVPVEGQGFATAMRLRTPAGLPTDSSREYSIRVRALVTASVKKDDWILATFWVRALERTHPTAYVKLNYERSVSPYTKSLSTRLDVPDSWKRYSIPFKIAEDYQPNQSYFDFWVGFDPQVIEIGGVSLLNQGQAFNPNEVDTGYTYQGREADSTWRAEAEARIEEIRKATVNFLVVDADGVPQPEAKVEVRMKRHAFPFGTAVVASALLGTTADDEKYRQAYFANFNAAVFENDFKWGTFEANRARSLRALDWLGGQGIQHIRGHTMVWPGWQYLPADVRALSSNPEALRARVNARILDAGRSAAGKFKDWDVVNEPIVNRDLQNILGEDELAAWYRLAREADPAARLVLNEYNIIANDDRNKADKYFAMIEWLRAQEAPLDVIGEQGHFGFALTGMRRSKEILDRFATFGLPIQITEFDVDVYDEKLQADYTRDFLTLCFSHPSVDAFLLWGFWENRHWKPAAAMLRRDFSVKPNGEAWRSLIYEKWWSNVDVNLDAEAYASTRVFLGDYEFTARLNDKVVTILAPVTKEGANIKFQLP
jgi:endo-1,4-beta-xylanase